MGLIDKELLQKHAKEERLLRFKEFVQEQKATDSPGMSNACLQSDGYRDFYGKVVFGTGMHSNLWILSTASNPKALIFTNKSTAKSYAKSLQKILQENGYPSSKAWAEQVAVATSTPRPYSKLFAPTITFEPEPRFIIRMCVK